MSENLPEQATEVAETSFEIPSSFVQDGKILGQFENVNQLLDAVAGGKTVDVPAEAPVSPPVESETAPAPTALEIPKVDPAAPQDGPMEADVLDNLEALAQQNGGVVPESAYADMAAKGVGRSLVDATLQGRAASRMAEASRVSAQVGGDAALNAALEYGKSLAPEVQAQINQDLAAGSESTKVAIIRDLLAQSGQGGASRNVAGGLGSNPSELPFASQAELLAAQRDPRYSSDPAYRGKVLARLKGANLR